MGAIITDGTKMLGDKRVPYVVDPKGLDNDETIAEAIKYGYVVGKQDQISANAKGVMKAMLDGIKKDGDGRKIDEYFSLQPFARGRLDNITDDLDKSKIAVKVRARALKQLKLNATDWTVILEGSTGNLVVNGISTGEMSGVINVGETVHINGFNLTLGAGDTVSWSVPSKGKSGTVAASKLTSEYTRIDVAGDALSELASATYDGETIVWTIKIGNLRAVKTATLSVR